MSMIKHNGKEYEAKCDLCNRWATSDELNKAKLILSSLGGDIYCLECAKNILEEVDAELEGDWAEMESECDS